MIKFYNAAIVFNVALNAFYNCFLDLGQICVLIEFFIFQFSIN